MMKFHWGHGIFVFFFAFVALMVFMAVKSYQTDFDLVAKDYYAQELAYQGKIDKMANEKKLTKSVELAKVSKGLEISFPDAQLVEGISGTVLFFRPSDDQLDRIFDLNLDKSGNQFFAAEQFATGMYKVKVEWKAGETEFFKEQSIVF